MATLRSSPTGRRSAPRLLAALLLGGLLASCVATGDQSAARRTRPLRAAPSAAPLAASGASAAPKKATVDATPADRAPEVPRDVTPLEVRDDIVLAVHGGAGTILRERMTPELDRAYRAALAEALLAGYQVLDQGGSAEAAVVAALQPLEDSPLFNAGRGAVLNDGGAVELDASIMVGRSGQAGAVAGVTQVRHPIEAARRVMRETEHVLLAGAGADRFAKEQGLELMDPTWFVTPHRQRQLEALQAEDRGDVASGGPGSDSKFGTVGCVARDAGGHLAAGTSTGGMARKAWGRVGDSPIIGAGTWAADATCAVSCTGHGEYFIRRAIAHQIHARMLHGGAGIEAAARAAILDDLPRGGGSGGCVALDGAGRMVAPFTTPGMYRGWVDAQGRVTVRIHGDER